MERERFSKQRESVQSRFVDSSEGAAAEADDLVSSLMKTRGYQVSDFQRVADGKKGCLAEENGGQYPGNVRPPLLLPLLQRHPTARSAH